MNKQEAIEKIEKEKSNLNAWEDLTRNRALDDALAIVRKLDEPEKPVLTKEEAEWVEGLKEEQERRPFWTKYSLLYFITRCGFGYGFSYDHKDREIELKHYPHEIHAEKERLANAILYGYEVEKEKLYTARLKLVTYKLQGYINKIKESNALIVADSDKSNSLYQVHFTQAELEGLGVWDNPAFEIEEVAE